MILIHVLWTIFSGFRLVRPSGNTKLGYPDIARVWEAAKFGACSHLTIVVDSCYSGWWAPWPKFCCKRVKELVDYVPLLNYLFLSGAATSTKFAGANFHLTQDPYYTTIINNEAES